MWFIWDDSITITNKNITSLMWVEFILEETFLMFNYLCEYYIYICYVHKTHIPIGWYFLKEINTYSTTIFWRQWHLCLVVYWRILSSFIMKGLEFIGIFLTMNAQLITWVFVYTFFWSHMWMPYKYCYIYNVNFP